MRNRAMASVTAAILMLFVANCGDVAPGLVDQAEPAQSGSVNRMEDPPLPTQAEGTTVTEEEATVTFVIDGDTVDVALVDDVVERIRLPQIDTPEVGECGYEESTAVLEAQIAGQDVLLVSTEAGPDRDTYGRLLRAVEISGDDVGQYLIRMASPTGSGAMLTRTGGWLQCTRWQRATLATHPPACGPHVAGDRRAACGFVSDPA